MSGAELVTKGDLAEVKVELKANILEAEHRLEDKTPALKTEIGAAKVDLLKTILGAVAINSVVVVGAVFGLAKLLGH